MKQIKFMWRISALKHFLIGAILGVITLCVFWNIVIKGHILWGSDFITTYLPYKQFFYEEIKYHRSIPLWNPYLFGGMPFWAFFESTMFYPLDLLFWIISPEKVYGYTMALHILLGGLFMYILCQTIRFSKWGSLFAAIIFSYNSFIMPVLSLGRMVHTQSYVWTPLILCLLARSLESKRPYSLAIWTGLCWGLQILAADPQTAFYTFGALTLFLLIYYNALASIKRCIHTIKLLIIVFMAGVGLSSIQVLPAMELVSLCTRGAIKTFEMVTLGSFPLQGIITILMPHFFGNLYDNNLWVSNIPWSYPMYNLYAGIIPLFLISFVRYSPKENGRLVLFCIILGLLALVLSMGKNTPFYHLIYQLPGFNSFRAPSKAIVLWMLAVSILAGKGLDDLASATDDKSLHMWTILFLLTISFIIMDLLFFGNPRRCLKLFSFFLLDPISPHYMANAEKIIQGQFHRMTILLTLSSIILYLGYKRLLRRNLWIALSLVILLVDLYGLNHRYVQSFEEKYLLFKTNKTQLANIFKKDKEVFRVGGIGSDFGPNAEMYYGLQSPSGGGPLILYRYYLYIDQFYHKVASRGWQVLRYGVKGSEKFMDMLNVKYDIDYKNRIFALRKSFLPRALLVPGFKILPTSQILSFMESSDFKPRNTVLFEKDALPKGLSKKTPLAINQEIGTCKILRYRPNQIQIKVNANMDTFLVLNDIYYPGWRCYVDGVPTKINRCNFIFRTIRVQKGDHKVHFIFEPFLVKVGIALTFATLIFSLLVFSRHHLKKSC